MSNFPSVCPSVPGPVGSAPLISSATTQFLVFALGEKMYGVDMNKVQELRRYDLIPPIPHAPGALAGREGLQALVRPLAEINVELIIKNPVPDQATTVLVFEFGDPVMGLVVDRVEGLIGLIGQQIQVPPEHGETVDASYLFGLSTLKGRMLLLIDVDKLLAG